MVYAGLYALRVARLAGYPFDLDQGEGYDVYSGLALLQGQPIYTWNAQPPYYSSNYPPVYSIFVAATALLVGPSLLAGRLVSVLAWLLVAALVFWSARRRGGLLAGLVSAGLLLASTYAFHTTPLARVNALAALFSLGGLLLLEGAGRARLVAGGALLLLALYTKPTAVDAAAAGLAGVWLGDRRSAVGLTVGLALAGGMALLALQALTGGAFFLNVVQGNVNPFSPDQLLAYWANFAALHAVALALAGAELVAAWRERRLGPLHFFLLTGQAMALGVGKWGAGESYFLSAVVAASLLAGPAAARLARAAPSTLAPLLPLALAAQLAYGTHGELAMLHPALADRGLQGRALGALPSPDDERAGWELVKRLREVGGPVLSEDPAFALAAGQDVIGNATHLRNLHQAGLWVSDGLVADVRARRYHMVVLHAELYPEPVLAAIGRSYYLDDTFQVYGAEQQLFLPGGD